MLLLLVISLLLLIIVFLLFLSFPQSLAESFALVASTIDKAILPKSEDRCGIFAIQKSFGKNITVISKSNAPNPDPLFSWRGPRTSYPRPQSDCEKHPIKLSALLGIGGGGD